MPQRHTKRQHAGAAAERAAKAKDSKYSELDGAHHFIAVASETLGPWAVDSLRFLRELGRRLAVHTHEPRAPNFLLQNLSVAFQRGNAASILATLPNDKPLGETFYIL